MTAISSTTTAEEAYEIGLDAYVYFYPLILMDVTRRISINSPAGARPGMGPMNAFHHLRAYPPASFREVVRPNFDTLYSIAWLDLTKEPMIVAAPDTDGRYYLLPMLDMWTDVFAAPGKRTSGTHAGSFAVVPMGWTGRLPEGVSRIDAPTAYVWIIGRTQTNGVKDYATVNKVQDGYTLTPLSRWGQPSTPVNATIDQAVDMKTPPPVQVSTMSAAKYLGYAAELMKLNPRTSLTGRQSRDSAESVLNQAGVLSSTRPHPRSRRRLIVPFQTVSSRCGRRPPPWRKSSTTGR